MRFTVDIISDEGVGGWLTPDNPSKTPAVIAVVNGRERHVVRASIHRPDVQGAGFHETGLCGFAVNATVCPWYRADGSLELYDSESNVLLYRRPQPESSPIQLLYLDSATTPLFDICRHAAPAVQMLYSAAEMIGEETLNNIFLLDQPSIIVSGALFMGRYEVALRARRWRSAICLAHPFRELAGRLLRLQTLAPSTPGSWRNLGDEDLIGHFESVDLTSPASLGRAFRRLSTEQFYTLANPVTAMLVAYRRGQRVEADQVGRALGILAGFALVGIDEHLDLFLDGLDQLLGRSDLPRDIRVEDPRLEQVMDALEECRQAQDLIELDLALYVETQRAVAAAAEVA